MEANRYTLMRVRPEFSAQGSAAISLLTFLAAGMQSCDSRSVHAAGTNTSATHLTGPANTEAVESPAAAIANSGPRRVGYTATLRVRTAPFPAHPDVRVHVPASFVPGGRVNLVVFLHGWNGCVEVIGAVDNCPCTPGGPVRYAMDLVRSVDSAGVNAVLVVPQLAFDARSSSPGRLSERGVFRELIAEVLAHPDLAAAIGGARSIDDVGRVILAAHSGAFVPAAAVLSKGGVDVHEVHLLDALYREEPVFEAWIRTHASEFAPTSAGRRRFSVIYSDNEGTGARSRALLSRVSDALPHSDGAGLVREHRLPSSPPPDFYGAGLFSLRTAVVHEDIPRVFLVPLLETAGLSQ